MSAPRERCPYCGSGDGGSRAGVFQCAGCDSIADVQPGGVSWYPSHRIGEQRAAAIEARRNRATHPRCGDQTSCAKCRRDIEYGGPRRRRGQEAGALAGTMAGGWHDRGGDSWCPEYAGGGLHRPVSDQ